MLTASTEFVTAVTNYQREFDNRLTFTYSNYSYEVRGATVSISQVFTENDDVISLGGAYSKKCIISMPVPENSSSMSWSKSRIKVECGIKVDDQNFEYLTLGYFYPFKVSTADNGFSLKIEAYDKMSDLAKPYVTTISTLPTTDTAIVNDICTQFGFTFSGTTTGRSIDRIYSCTAQKMLGWLAGLQGKNAVLDEQEAIKFTGFTTTNYKIPRTFQKQNGFDKGERNTVITAVLSGTTFEGGQVKKGSGRGVVFENPYINQSEVNAIYNTLANKSYVAGTLGWFGDPCVECGDIVRVNTAGTAYKDFLVTKNEINLTGGLSMTSTAAGTPDSNVSFDGYSTELESKLINSQQQLSDYVNSSITQTASNITSQVTSLTNELHNDYSTTTQMNSAISQSASGVTSQVTDLETELHNNYSTTTAMNSAISQSASGITASVSSTYETKTDATSKLNTAKGYTDSEVSSAKAEIKVTTDGISSTVSNKVGKNEVISSINQSSESVSINASKVNLNGYVTASSLGSNGTTTIDGSRITTGTISASRLNLSGYVTVSSLGSNGTTTIDASRITTGTINAARLNLSSYAKFSDLSTAGGTVINGSNIITGTIDASLATITNINASNITTGTINASRLNLTGYVQSSALATAGRTTINGSNITTGSINANLITSGTINADLIKSGTLNASLVTVSSTSGNNTVAINNGALASYSSTTGSQAHVTAGHLITSYNGSFRTQAYGGYSSAYNNIFYDDGTTAAAGMYRDATHPPRIFLNKIDGGTTILATANDGRINCTTIQATNFLDANGNSIIGGSGSSTSPTFNNVRCSNISATSSISLYEGSSKSAELYYDGDTRLRLISSPCTAYYKPSGLTIYKNSDSVVQIGIDSNGHGYVKVKKSSGWVSL